MRVVPSLVWARLSYRPLRWLLVVAGVATVTVLPVVSQGSATVVAAQALRYGVNALPAGQRSLIVSYAGVELSQAELDRLDSSPSRQLLRISKGPLLRQVLFRRIADSKGGTFFLGAADHLMSDVRLTSGRAPASCTPTRCEVVVVGQGTPALEPSLGLVVVGRAVRTDPLLLTGTFDPGHDAPLLLADGVVAVQQLASLEQFQRSYGWVVPLDIDRVVGHGVASYLALSADVADKLFRTDPGLILTAPDVVLQDQAARAQLSSRRFALLSGAATALLLGFAVIAAIGLRRDELAFLDLLRRRGASRATTRAVTVAEAAAPVLVGVVLGLCVGGGVAAILAAHNGLPRLSTGLGAVGAAAPATAVTAVLAIAIVVVTSSWAVGAQARTAWRVVDAAVVVGLATAALAIGRGVIGTTALGSGIDPLLTALPVIAVVCGGLLAARVWPWLASSVGRALPRGWLGARLGLLGVVRRPFRPVATVAFLTAATGVVVFAGGYRSTLDQGAVDQAAFAVPLDGTVTTGANLERPLDVQPLTAYAAAAAGAHVFPVVRSTASVRVSATEATSADLLGVDPLALPLVHSWGHDVGGGDPRRIASSLAVPPALSTAAVPSGARSLWIPATGNVEQLSVVAWFRSGDGRDYGLTLALVGSRWTATLPDAPGGLHMIALTLAESTDYATKHQHKIGEGSTDVTVLSGRVTFGAVEYRSGIGAVVGEGASPPWTGWASAGARVASSPSTLAVAYSFTGSLVVVRPNALAAQVLPAIVDPATAARVGSGNLELVDTGGTALRLRIVGTLPRFPTVGPAFVLVDVRGLADALDASEPGAGSVAELWLSAGRGQANELGSTLGRPPYDRLTVAVRAQREAGLRADPLAVGARSLLTFGALLALVVAVLSLVLLVLAERRDESAELYAWESDGVAPSTLRLSLFVRALAVVVVALPVGVLTGLVLSRVTTTLVSLTAVGTAPRPPLQLSVGLWWVTAVLGAGLFVAVLASGAGALGALRERLPVRPELDLR